MNIPANILMATTFLSRWYGASPTIVTSIVPDGRVETRSFQNGSIAALTSWLQDANKQSRNCYFVINQPQHATNKKAQKADITLVRCFHVDIDPQQNETVEACKSRALTQLGAHTPRPSVVVDSGNGVQAYWLLSDPISLDGTEESWRRAEAYNKHLAQVFGGDHCYNVDRIFRIPGTVNVPNKKKRSQGRVEAVATLLEDLSSWKPYPVADFRLHWMHVLSQAEWRV